MIHLFQNPLNPCSRTQIHKPSSILQSTTYQSSTVHFPRSSLSHPPYNNDEPPPPPPLPPHHTTFSFPHLLTFASSTPLHMVFLIISISKLMMCRLCDARGGGGGLPRWVAELDAWYNFISYEWYERRTRGRDDHGSSTAAAVMQLLPEWRRHPSCGCHGHTTGAGDWW